MVTRDKTELDFRICNSFDTANRKCSNPATDRKAYQGDYLLLEILRKLLVVQKDVWVVELVVPSILELLDAASHAIDITIACW